MIAALVRHGDYEQPAGVPSAHLPHPLTERGEAQALGAARRLIELAGEHRLALAPVLHASPLRRAFQTASIMADELTRSLATPFTVEETADLLERSVGAAANLTMTEIARLVERDPRLPPLPSGWKAMPTFKLPVPGAESLMEAGARAARWIERRLAALAPQARDTCVVFVGHGGAFRHAAVHLGVLPMQAAAELSMHHARPVLLERHADATVSHLAGSWKSRRRAAPVGDDA